MQYQALKSDVFPRQDQKKGGVQSRGEEKGNPVNTVLTMIDVFSLTRDSSFLYGYIKDEILALLNQMTSR